jgi:hypothetical protein
MIAFHDSAKLFIAQESEWGVQPAGVFQTIPFQRETLIPERRYRYPSSLEGSGTPPAPVAIEEMASGDIEMLATTNNMQLLIPQILNTAVVSGSADVSNRSVNAEGVMLLDDVLPDLQLKDFIFMHGTAEHNGWQIATQQQGASVLSIEGLPADTTMPRESMVNLNAYSPSSAARSIAIYKTYRDGEDWQHLQGGMINRLTLDLAEGELFTASISVLGREMSVTSASPRTSRTPEYPLGYAYGLKRFNLNASNDTALLTQDNSVITGFRLVMERVGMTPQYALGSIKPKLILPGELAVYGVIDLLIGNYKLFRWMNEGQSIEMSFALEDEASGGMAFYLPLIQLSGVDVPPSSDGEPMRARFRFDAHASGTQPMLKTFIQPSL